MNFFITPPVVIGLCFAVLLLSFAAYLVGWHRKATSARWLAAFCLVFVVMFNTWNVLTAIEPLLISQEVTFWVFCIGQGCLLLFALTLQQFAYTFRSNPYPREARVLLVLGGGLAAVVFALFVPIRMGDSGVFSLISILSFVGSGLLCVWTLIMLARKTVHFSRLSVAQSTPDAPAANRGIWQHLRHPQGRAAQAFRVYFGVMSLPFFIVILGGLMWGAGLTAAIIQVLWVSCVFLFIYGVIIAYVTYTPQATTVQVKLVGTVLATVLLLLALVSTVMFDDQALIQQTGSVTPAPHRLLFTPDGEQGYAATRTDFDPAQTPLLPLGERQPLEDDSEIGVAIGFSFPFYGTQWDTMYVNTNGVIGLGAPVKGGMLRGYVPMHLLYRAPKIAPLFADFTTRTGGVFVERAPEQVAITWYELSLVGGDSAARYTMRATLNRTGRVGFEYATLAGQPLAETSAAFGGRGLIPGGEDPQVNTFSFADERVRTRTPGAALVEMFAEPVLIASHQLGMKLLMLLGAVTVFCLLVLPVVFRASLLRPLARLLGGLQEVEQGNLDSAVTIPTHDEVGQLAEHFNAMTRTLREAEQQLKDYATTLEHKVEERTTELSRSLEDLRAAQARLVHAEKMASLGALTAGIAHEIKNPLNFINNFAEVNAELAQELREALADGDDPKALLADLEQNATVIAQHGKRADSIVRNMMAHARTGSHERVPTDLNALVNEHLDLAYHGKRAQVPDFSVTIERDLDEAVGEVEVVPQDIGRVVLNLLSNAFDVLDGVAEARVKVMTKRTNGQVEIRVADNGPGIPEEVQARVFEPFFTTKPTGQGTGLGLSLSYDIVTQGHGGTMTVESEQAHGASFVLTLPVYKKRQP